MDRPKNKKEKLDRFLMIYGNIQLWTFITTMVMVAVIYLLNPAVHYYEIVGPDQEETQQWLEGLDIIDETQTSAVEFQKISREQLEEMTKEYNRLATITFICILGWFFSQKEKRVRLKELYLEVKKKVKKIMKE